MAIRELIVRTYAEWTALSALRTGSPIRSRKSVYRAIRQLDFSQLVDPSLGRIECEEFERWHTGALRRLGEVEPALAQQIGWAAKIVNVYLKTYAYVGDQGRANLRGCLHPPIDAGLWKGVKRQFRGRDDILGDTHCVTTIQAITTPELYAQLIRGLRAAATELGCSLIEVEQLWEGTKVPGEA